MQILIMRAGGTHVRSFHLGLWQVLAGAVAALGLSVLVCALGYQFVLQKAVRENWPVVSQVVQALRHREALSRDRYLRENLDAMASKVGDLQAKLVELEAMSDRVSTLAGVKLDEARAPLKAASGAAPTAVRG